MGRLPALIGCCAIVAFCNDPSKPSAGGRAEQVVTSASATPSVAPSVSASAPSARRGTLCDRTERTLTKVTPSFVDAQGTRTDHAKLPMDDKRLVWVNFFAAWCGPCKEEIPRIQRFEKQLQKDGVMVDIAFVSIDDDLRQLGGFFAAQPATGIKSSFWLPEGATRTAWLSSLKMKSDPELPEHVIVDGRGRSKCFIRGAIEDSDYAELALALR